MDYKLKLKLSELDTINDINLKDKIIQDLGTLIQSNASLETELKNVISYHKKEKQQFLQFIKACGYEDVSGRYDFGYGNTPPLKPGDVYLNGSIFRKC